MFCFRRFASGYFFRFSGFSVRPHGVFPDGLVGVVCSYGSEFFGACVESVEFHFLLPIRYPIIAPIRKHRPEATATGAVRSVIA